MENIEEIQKKSLTISDKTEKKLYCIKEYGFKCDDCFEKSFGFKFTTEKQGNTNNYDILVYLDNKRYFIQKNSRIINFIIKKKNNIRFIYNCEYFKKIIHDLNIQYFSTRSEKLDNSLESEFSDNDIYDLYKQENVVTIFKIEADEKKLKDLFDDRNKMNREIISDLSLNSAFYYPENKNDKLDLDIFSKNIETVNSFYWGDDKNILYLLGPKGSSKSLFLMNCCYVFNAMEYHTLYINYKILKNLDEKERKNIFKKEMVYLFNDFNKFEDFYNAKYHRLIKGGKNAFLHGLKEFVQTLLNIYENTFENKIILTIDNFDEDNENLFSEMEKIINLVNENPKKIKLIISGNSVFLKKKFELFLKNKNFSDIIEKQELFLYEIKLEDKNEIKSLVAFKYRKIINEEELEKTLLNEEKEFCKKYSLFGLYFSIVNNEQNLLLEKLLKYLYIIPFEYLTFSINEDKSIKFKYFNPIFFRAVQQSIKSEVKEKSLNFLLKNDNMDYLINGIYEEKLLNTLITYNKLNLENLKTSENNLLEIEKICEFKYKIYKKISKNLDNKLPIIINQTNYRGEFYDLLVLIPKKDIEGNIIFTAYMIQIGTNKTKAQIEEIKSDFDNNKKEYLDGISIFIDNKIKIKNIELLFIFDKETQNNLSLKKTKISIFGSKYCFKNRIKYYCFSYDEYKLYKSFDSKVYFEVKEFGDFDKFIFKKNWSSYLMDIFNNILTDDELDFINSKITKGTIEDYSIFIKESIKFEDIKIDNNNIYILRNEKNKYFVINCVIYNLLAEKSEKNKENIVIDKKEIFDVYILSPVNIDGGLKKESK